MKHIKNINEYFSNINEGINYNGGADADLLEVGSQLLSGTGKNSEDMEDKDVEAVAVEAMKKAKPVPLTGIIKKDVPALLKYISDAFKRCGVELDINNVTIDSSNFANELEIPVVDTEYYLLTMLDYNELAYNGSEFVIGATFYNDEEGSLDDGQIADLSNQGDVTKACAEFKQYLENQKK
jgi:hypothetical protein